MPTNTKMRLPRCGRSAGDRLRDAIRSLAGDHATVAQHSERAWASITFEGARHTLQLTFEGVTALTTGEAFIAALPDHEFLIPGQLVADAAIIAVDHALLPTPRLTVTCELLLLKDT